LEQVAHLWQRDRATHVSIGDFMGVGYFEAKF